MNASRAVTTSGNAGAPLPTFAGHAVGHIYSSRLTHGVGGGVVSIELQLGRHAWSCKHPTILLQEPPGKRPIARACHRTEPALRTCKLPVWW